jgi:hypothetical protein
MWNKTLLSGLRWVSAMTETVGFYCWVGTNFNRVRIVAKTADWLCHICPSVYPHTLGRLSLQGFTWNLILGPAIKICRANPKLVKIGQQYQVCYSEDLSLLYCCRRHKFAIQALLCNTVLYCLEWNYLNITHNALLISMATVVMRPRRNVTFYV